MPHERGAPSGDRCPHGDVTCPCQDWGDPCHYEGDDPFECPAPGQVDGHVLHCHVEGCGHPDDDCGLMALGCPQAPVPTEFMTNLDELRGTPWWRCGVARSVHVMMDEQ